MSLPASPCDSIPKQTIQVARAAFPTGNASIRMRDALGPIYTNPTFAALFSHPGRPAEAPAHHARLAAGAPGHPDAAAGVAAAVLREST